MGKLVLYAMDLSPPCRNVILVLKNLGLEYENKDVDLMKGEQKTPEFLSLNPRGKVPVLIDDDFVLYESRAIAAYLVNVYGAGANQSSLYPSEPKARALVDQVLYVSENTSEMVMKYVDVGGVVFGDSQPQEENIKHVKQALDIYEQYLTKTEFVAANYLTIADFFMTTAILSLQLPGYDDFANYPKTKAWIEKMKALPYFMETNAAQLEKFTKMYTEKLKKN